MSTMELKPPPRPFTEYILFYQLERAYILQNLGVVPSLKEEETFTISDPSYNGPELPARYRGVVLSKDWHTPKKINKKKRQHRASHGKISFADLSKKVAASWRNAERDVKLFCAELATISGQLYRREMREYTQLAQAKLLAKSEAETKFEQKEEVSTAKRPDLCASMHGGHPHPSTLCAMCGHRDRIATASAQTFQDVWDEDLMEMWAARTA